MTNQQDRLSPEQYKAIIKGKGWTYRALATHWGITPVWLSNISRSLERPKHYDDAVMGLPTFDNLNRNIKRRHQQADAYIQKMDKGRKATGAYKYRGHVVMGSILTVTEDFGSLAQAGSRGIVFQIKLTSAGEEYGIIFETGKWEWFDVNLVDRYLADTGLISEEASQYQFKSEERLKEDFKVGGFLF